mmetsp:Transcript_14544/g.12350  ORF Transcript_14544/g.12350 Transcript_14544/m.12350 type:complete len:132 (+) Transcript_14544:1636-2031(+)
MLAEEAKKLEEAKNAEAESGQIKVEADKPNKAFDIEDDIVRNISQANPIVDFRRMINEKAEDLTNSAIEQMTKLIEKFIEESFQGNLYDKALDCTKELRKGAVQEDEAPAFNDFLHMLKDKYAQGKHTKFW